MEADETDGAEGEGAQSDGEKYQVGALGEELVGGVTLVRPALSRMAGMTSHTRSAIVRPPLLADSLGLTAAGSMTYPLSQPQSPLCGIGASALAPPLL